MLYNLRKQVQVLPDPQKLCASGGMVYTLVLEANAERIESSSLSLRTTFKKTMKYINTITQISVGLQTDNPIYGECVRVRLEDECGGMFIVLEQDGDNNQNEVRIGLDEWDNICQAVLMLKNQDLVK